MDENGNPVTVETYDHRREVFIFVGNKSTLPANRAEIESLIEKWRKED